MGRRSEPVPIILGHEIIGRIVQFGENAPTTDARGLTANIGDRITWAVGVGCGRCYFCRNELPQKCERLFKYGHHKLHADRPTGGGLADQIVLAPGTVWYKVPETIPDAVGAMANCATATVAGLMRAASPIASKSVAVLGAGVLGLTACAMSRSAGAMQVLGVDCNAQCRERALRFGATSVSSADRSELREQVMALTEGRGVDVAIELAGTADSVENALEIARIGGQVLLAGTVAPTGPVTFDPEQVVRKLVTIEGVHNYHPRDLDVALDFLETHGQTYPFSELIAGEYPLEHAVDAFEFARNAPGVRVVVRP
jgi:alcohol dehydrogenase